jgi:epoxyqueuosine reductase
MTPGERLAADLRSVGLQSGLEAIGFAPAEPFITTRGDLVRRRAEGLHGGMQFTYRNPGRSTDPRRALPGARTLVVGARRYLRQPPSSCPAAVPARVARYSWVDHYGPLRAALGAVAARLEAAGFRARVVADDNALVDREAARRAGIGWFGKNTNLLLPGRGSWFVLGSVITDAALPASAPARGGCGACARCLPACPTGALVAPGVLDARRCLAWLLQAPGVFPSAHRVAVGDRMYGCDDCQEVCPPNQADSRRRPPPTAEDGSEAAADALWVLGATDAELLERYGRWYIPGRQPCYLRRNALLVLGNTADPARSDVRAAIGAALAHPDPLVRGHAVWAAARLGYDDLVSGARDDPDPLVRAEWDGTVSVEVRPAQPPGVAGSGVDPPGRLSAAASDPLLR